MSEKFLTLLGRGFKIVLSQCAWVLKKSAWIFEQFCLLIDLYPLEIEGSLNNLDIDCVWVFSVIADVIIKLLVAEVVAYTAKVGS